MSAVQYLRLSPITTAWLTCGWSLSRFSIFCGATYLPPEVLIRSFLRSVMQEAVRVELADVAGVEPALAVPALGGGLRPAVVAEGDVGAARQDLAVGRDAQLAAVERPADGAELEALGLVHRQAGGRLGEPVALEDRDG